MAELKSLRAPLLWTAYLLIPATGWGLLHGVPIGLAGAAVLFAIWWTWRFDGALPARSALIALVVVKLIAGAFISIERGLEADYFANAQWVQPIERSTHFHSGSFTRIDQRLAFGAPGRPDFPLYFFNDVARFNFFQRGEPERDTLPFSVTWQAYVRAPQTEDRRKFYLRGKGVTADLWVDGAQTVRLEPTAEEAFERAHWPAGLRRLTVRVSVPAGASRQFEAGFVDPDGQQTPLGASNVLARPYRQWRLSADRVVGIASRIADLLLLSILAAVFALTTWRMIEDARLGTPGRRRAIVALSWVAIMASGLLFAKPAVDRLVVLEGGNDYLTYESYARDILLNGPLMLLGSPVGHGTAFYYQPLYPYFLALTHLIFGEDLSSVYLAQWMLACVTVLAIWKVSVLLFGKQIGNVALALGGLYFVSELVPMAGMLLNENIFIPLLVVWALSMIKMVTAESRPAAGIRAGVVGGLAALARSTALITWVCALPVLAVAQRRAGKNLQSLVLMVAIMIGVVSVATVRNWIVSKTFVPVASSFGVNLFLGNQPPPGVAIRPGSDYVSTVVQFAQTAPALFVQNVSHKALYALGFFDAYVPGAGTAPGLVVTWLAALIGIGVVILGRAADGLRGPIQVLPFVLSVSQFLAVTLIFPLERLIIPFYVLLLPYAAVGIVWFVQVLVPPEAA